MKRKNLITTVLLAAFTAPALAEEQPDELPPVPQQQLEQVEQAPEGLDVNTSRMMTPEEAERLGIHNLVLELEGAWLQAVQPEAKPREFVRGPFLGVNAKPLDLKTAKELGLKRSTGLLVTYAPGNGPAGTAGLKKGDVLTKLNDQILINAEQFAVLVRSQAIGDTVTLHGLREGKPIKLEAKLGEADISPLGPGGEDLDQAWHLQFSPIGSPLRPEVEIAPGLWIGDGWGEARIEMLDDRAMPEQVREMIKKLEQQMLQQRQDMDKQMQQLRQQLDLDIEKLREGAVIPKGDGEVRRQMQTAMMWSDGKHNILLGKHNDKTQLTITGHDDKVLYDGPLPKDGQIEGLSKDVQQKVDQLLNNKRIEHRIPPEEQPKQPEQ